jgi:hypothetical protein
MSNTLDPPRCHGSIRLKSATQRTLSNAFLNATLEGNTYVKYPPGYHIKRHTWLLTKGTVWASRIPQALDLLALGHVDVLDHQDRA